MAMCAAATTFAGGLQPGDGNARPPMLEVEVLATVGRDIREGGDGVCNHACDACGMMPVTDHAFVYGQPGWAARKQLSEHGVAQRLAAPDTDWLRSLGR